jgi:hypothetical protein
VRRSSANVSRPCRPPDLARTPGEEEGTDGKAGRVAGDRPARIGDGQEDARKRRPCHGADRLRRPQEAVCLLQPIGGHHGRDHRGGGRVEERGPQALGRIEDPQHPHLRVPGDQEHSHQSHHRGPHDVGEEHRLARGESIGPDTADQEQAGEGDTSCREDEPQGSHAPVETEDSERECDRGDAVP